MASQVPIDDNSNTKSEGTMTFHKKRARRVSFAENTSVHIFDRDEDSGTPVDPKPPSSPSDELGSAERNREPGQLFWPEDEYDNENNNEDDYLNEPGSRSPWFRFGVSPSSGGSTVGSANSNDEDNFFGPVSANFIRRDLLDSSASDANHDQTMDSTAFSMHFHSIARSESDMELKASTGVHLSFDEKTPTQDSIPINTGTPMVMTLANKQTHQPSVSGSKSSPNSESNDMSIVGEYHHKYNYGELSPTLDALMADPFNISTQSSPKYSEAIKENGANLMDLSCDEGNNLEGVFGHDLVNGVASLENNGVSVVNGGSTFIMATPTTNTKEVVVVKDAFQIKSNFDFSAIGQPNSNPSPKNTNYINDVIGKEHRSPFVGAIPSKSPSYVTPSHKYSSVFVRTENQGHVLNNQSVQKSISKLKMIEASPFSDSLNAKFQDSITKPSKMTPLNSLLEKNYKSPLLSSMIIDSGHLSSKKRSKESSTLMDDIRSIKSPQRFDLSSQKRLKIVNTTTTEVRRSPLRVEKSSPLNTEEKMVDIREVSVSVHEVHCDLETKGGPTISSMDKGVSSTVLHEGTDKQSCKKNLHNQFCESPSNKQPHNIHQDEDMMVEIPTTTHTSPKAHVNPEISNDNETSTIVHKFKPPTEINEIVSNGMKEVLSQSVDKFNLHAIDRLAGIVDQLFMSKRYQLLSDEIQSQKSVVDTSKNLQQKRVSETKSILCKIVHEKAKLQLMQVKRERLQKRVKSLASEISESEELQSRFPPNVMSVSMKVNEESQIDIDKVTSTRQTLDHVDQRIEKLTKSFHNSCKMKEELSALDTITFVKNHLKKQACCQIIRKDMQLWVVDNLKSRNGCHSVDLNYLDLLTQRLTVNSGQVPSVSISHELYDVNISKMFKDMEASTAFRFVFNGGTTQKHVDAINLAKETQVTGARFGNLLDVMEEIQHSRIDLKNLISTRFYTPIADQLDLELCFFDPKHRTKATVTLNTSCLGRGIYPSEIIPYQIHIPSNDPQKSSPTLANDIKEAIEGLKTGFLRIQRLFKISKLM